MFYMISLIKKYATMSALHIQDTKKGCIKTNWRKRKEPSVVELRYELAFSKQTKTKTMKKPAEYTSNITNLCNGNTLTGHFF